MFIARIIDKQSLLKYVKKKNNASNQIIFVK